MEARSLSVSDCRRQAIEAPIEIVWELIRDVNRHPDWWPRVVDVESEGLEEGCTCRQVTESPFGYQELDVVVDRLDELRELRIRCVNTETFVDLALTAAGTGTFVDARFGMEPLNAGARLSMPLREGATFGAGYNRRWMRCSTSPSSGPMATVSLGPPGPNPASPPAPRVPPPRGLDPPRGRRSLRRGWPGHPR